MRVAADAAPRVRAEPADDAAAVGVRAAVDVAASVRTELGGGAAGTDLPAGGPDMARTPFRPAGRTCTHAPAGRERIVRTSALAGFDAGQKDDAGRACRRNWGA